MQELENYIIKTAGTLLVLVAIRQMTAKNDPFVYTCFGVLFLCGIALFVLSMEKEVE